MEILLDLYLVGKSKGNTQLYLIILPVLPVTALAVTLNKLNRGKRILTDDLIDVVNYTILVKINSFLE